jgi:MraZ protein
MVTRRTQYGWMAMGGMLCLFGVVLAYKLREENKVTAQGDQRPEAVAVANNPNLLITRELLTGLQEPPVLPAPAPPADLGKPPLPDPLPPPVDPGKPSIPAPDVPIVPPIDGGKAPAPMKGEPLPPLGTELPPLPPRENLPQIPASPGQPAPAEGPPQVVPAAAPEPSLPMPKSAPVEAAPPSLPPPGGEPKPSTQTPDVPPPTSVQPAAPPPAPSPKVEQAKNEQPGEPPLAPTPGPVEIYKVRRGGEAMRDIAKHTLNTSDRWSEIARLNPHLASDAVLPEGTVVRLPADACALEEFEFIKPLPSLRPKSAPAKPKVPQPLTGTYPGNLDDKRVLILPKAIREQLGSSETLLVSPGPDHCLWLTNQPHLDRLAEKIEQSSAREIDIRVFKRLYFAQTEKMSLSTDGRVKIPDRLAQFAGLQQEVVLVGIDDHFELWDAAKWKDYTQKKSAAARAAMVEQEP